MCRKIGCNRNVRNRVHKTEFGRIVKQQIEWKKPWKIMIDKILSTRSLAGYSLLYVPFSLSHQAWKMAIHWHSSVVLSSWLLVLFSWYRWSRQQKKISNDTKRDAFEFSWVSVLDMKKMNSASGIFKFPLYYFNDIKSWRRTGCIG